MKVKVRRSYLTLPEYPADAATEGSQNTRDNPLRPLLQVSWMEGTESRGDLVPILEVFGICRAPFDGPLI